jgi:hypothetical protein
MDYQKQESFAFSYGSFVWWVGVVEDRKDPKKLGRVRVRCLGYHTDDKEDIPSEKLFWAFPMQPITSGAMNGIGTSPTGIVEGTWVIGFFRDGENAQEPLVLGTLGGIPTDKNPEKGFFDPNGKYPKDEYMNEPDTNRLARGEKLDDTCIKQKKEDRDTGVKTAFDKEWDEPEVPENREYPYNHVRETETGHVEEWDDTEGSNRFHRYHNKGTFVEVHDDGKEVRHVKKEKYEIIFDDSHLHVKGDVNITVDGDANILVKKDANIEIEGDRNEYVHKDYNLKIDGDCNVEIGGNYSVKIEKVYNTEVGEYMWITTPLGVRSFDINSENHPPINFQFPWE